MNYSPYKNNKANALISLAGVALFALSLILVKLFSLPDVIWQGVFFVLAIVFCELMTKYFLPVYVYSLDDSSFIITKTTGKSARVVCNIDVRRITALYLHTDYKDRSDNSPKHIYNYTSNIIPSDSYVLVFEYSDCSEAVVIEINNEMADAIRGLTENR